MLQRMMVKSQQVSSFFSNCCFQLKLILFPIGLNYRRAELACFLRKELAGALTRAMLNKDVILSFGCPAAMVGRL